jgi:hypothetical protein
MYSALSNSFVILKYQKLMSTYKILQIFIPNLKDFLNVYINNHSSIRKIIVKNIIEN